MNTQNNTLCYAFTHQAFLIVGEREGRLNWFAGVRQSPKPDTSVAIASINLEEYLDKPTVSKIVDWYKNSKAANNYYVPCKSCSKRFECFTGNVSTGRIIVPSYFLDLTHLSIKRVTNLTVNNIINTDDFFTRGVIKYIYKNIEYGIRDVLKNLLD